MGNYMRVVMMGARPSSAFAVIGQAIGNGIAIALVCAMALVCAVPSVAAAQSVLDRSTPSGSPLDPTGRNSQQQSQQNDTRRTDGTSVDPSGGSYDNRIEPAQITGSDQVAASGTGEDATVNPRLKAPAPPNEFEKYIENAVGRKLPRFGASLLLPSNRDYAVPSTASVPPDYILNVGDTVAISLTGSTEGSVEKQIDTDGKIFLPHVGAIQLAGVRYADMKKRISQAIGTQYRGYNVTVGVRQLRGVRVYVTGFANNPGAYTVNSLSTMVNAVLAAGGPSSGGSFRAVQLRRHGEVIGNFDLYDLILRGDRSGDLVLQNEDVLFIPPVGKQVAVTGSVNSEAIYEARSGDTLRQVMQYAGGNNELADDSRVILYRLSDLDTKGGREVSVADLSLETVRGGDLIQVLSQGTLQRPLARQSVLVRIEGEVDRPGNYYVAANSTLTEVLQLAGGVTPRAFLYGTRLERASVRRQQREAFGEAIQQLEISLAAAPLTSGQTLDAGERASQLSGARSVLDRMREAEPDGRVVLDLPPEAAMFPSELVLENNDRIVIPPRATTVGVFGAVYRPASFFLSGTNKALRVRDYLARAGGPIRAADKSSIFVVRANGSVISRRNGALAAQVLPGDVVFVPVKTQSTSIWARIREISTVIFQFGVSAAALAAIK
jgi:protein involved in polysaccharide export with SLBB domain